MSKPIALAIDPSMNNLGWAYLDLNKVETDAYDINSIHSPWQYGLIHPQGGAQHRWENSYNQLQSRFIGDAPTHLICEWPTFFDSTRGKIAAMKGYTLNLAGMVGYFTGRINIPAENVHLYVPSQWKGNVPKQATAAKFVRRFGPEAEYILRHYSNDVIDAIMICEFWLQKINSVLI